MNKPTDATGQPLRVAELHPAVGVEIRGLSSDARLDDATIARLLTYEWRERDLVIWDNLAVQHARGNVNLDGPPRTLRKVFGPMPDRDRMNLRPTYSKVAGS